MEKITCDLCGEPYTDIENIQNKLNEIVDWINSYNKQWAKFWLEVVENPEFDKLKKRVNKINNWINEHEKNKGKGHKH